MHTYKGYKPSSCCWAPPSTCRTSSARAQWSTYTATRSGTENNDIFIIFFPFSFLSNIFYKILIDLKHWWITSCEFINNAHGLFTQNPNVPKYDFFSNLKVWSSISITSKSLRWKYISFRTVHYIPKHLEKVSIKFYIDWEWSKITSSSEWGYVFF